AAVVSADGTSMTSITTLPPSTGVESVAFVEGGFLLAGRQSFGIGILRVEIDGTVKGTPRAVTHDMTEFPHLAGTGATAHLVYGDFGSAEMDWAEVDALGTMLTRTKKIG